MAIVAQFSRKSKFKKIIETDLLENEIREVAKDTDSVKLAFSEFEIKTLKLVP